MYARQHRAYRKILKTADFITPDGIGIVKAAQILNQPVAERISGYDLFTHLLAWGNHHRKSVFFLGAREPVINSLNKVVHQRFPRLRVAGSHNGYFSDAKPIIQEIHHSHPDMVFVALGYPQQEQFISHYRHFNNGLWIGIGGSFDVLSGKVKKAPQFWVNHNLEWFYRLIKNPWRIGRMMALPKFMGVVYKQKISQLFKSNSK